MIHKIKYETFTALEVFSNKEILNECAELYSNHYGEWSVFHPDKNKRGKNIKLSSGRLIDWFNNNNSSLYVARNINHELIGYAIALKCNVRDRKNSISWVSQLVVHRDYRNSDVAKNILYSIWGESKNYAWGIISANPYAVRALEKATRRRSNLICIRKDKSRILNFLKTYLPYVNDDVEFLIDNNTSQINTGFYVDHSNVPNMVQNVSNNGIPWKLGELAEGWEWLAVTFNRQAQIKLSQKEIVDMIETSEDITKKAYSRMNVTEKQRWMNYTDNEVEFIMRELDLCKGQSLIDFGCGVGRHSTGLAERGVRVLGIDYLENNIDMALSNSQNISNLRFLCGDCRTFISEKKADAIVCLYDVIGSFVDDEENIKIIKGIYNNLKKGGVALISVMNYEMTSHFATKRFSFKDNPNDLLKLSSSRIMETTGNIFDPKFLIVDDETHIVYRKERFELGNELPVELIVRDRRYTKDEICAYLSNQGFEVNFAKYVNAGGWNNDYCAVDRRAKEILVKCTKI